MSDLYDYEKEFDPNEFDEKKTSDFYLNLRERVQAYVDSHTREGVGEMVLYVPDFFYMLVKLMGDERVPTSSKVQIGGAIAYFLSPVDIVPDFIPGLGWLDDLYLAMIVTDNLLNSVPLEVIKQYWLGDDDIVHLIKVTLDKLNDKLGLGAIKKILAKAGINLSAAPKAATEEPTDEEYHNPDFDIK